MTVNLKVPVTGRDAIAGNINFKAYGKRCILIVQLFFFSVQEIAAELVECPNITMVNTLRVASNSFKLQIAEKE